MPDEFPIIEEIIKRLAQRVEELQPHASADGVFEALAIVKRVLAEQAEHEEQQADPDDDDELTLIRGACL